MAELQTKEQHAESCCGDHSSHTHLGCCSEGKDVCSTCDGSGVVVENAGMCGGCEICGSREEREVPCPDCSAE